MKASEHTFEFQSYTIADAAQREAEYHERRASYWQMEYDDAVGIVESTIGAKVAKHAITGGYTVEVVIDYGDPDAYHQMQRAFKKLHDHKEAARELRSKEELYRTQVSRTYELDSADVHYFNLSNTRVPEDEEAVFG